MFKRATRTSKQSLALTVSALANPPSPKSRPIPIFFKPSKLSLCVAMISCSLSQPLWALGLGEIHSTSILGEQLRARIAVISDDAQLAADEVKVTRISFAEAERLGIDLMSDSRGIRVVARNTDQGLVVEVSSQQVINEPFLNFVVKLEWPKGSVYREYTLLLDLPMVAPSSSSAQPRAQSTADIGKKSNADISNVRNAPKRFRASLPSALPSTSTASNNSSKSTNSGSGYRVQIGDSLLLLAEQWLKSNPEAATGASLESVAQWLLDNNPKAFARGDANQLMAGMLLTMPNTIETKASSIIVSTSKEAVPEPGQPLAIGGEAALMNASNNPAMRLSAESDLEMWVSPALRSSTPLQATALTEQAAADQIANIEADQQPMPTVESAPASSTSRLRLGRAPISLDKNAQALSDQGFEESLELVVQSQLDVTHEVIDQLRRDNAELREQLTRLEQSDYLNTLSELIRLQGLQLSQLQVKQQSLAQAPIAVTGAQRISAAQDPNTIQNSGVTAAATNGTDASNTVLANVMNEAKAIGLVSLAPAARAGQVPVGFDSLDRSVNRASTPLSIIENIRGNTSDSADRAINLTGGLSMAVAAISATTLLRWAGVILVPLMLMGVYLMVALRQRNLYELVSASGTEPELDNQGFNLERLAELTLAEHTADQAGFNASVEAFHQADSFVAEGDEQELLDRQSMAAMLEKGLQLQAEDQLEASEITGESPGELSIDQMFEELDTEPVDHDLGDVFSSAMDQASSPENSARPETARQETCSERNTESFEDTSDALCEGTSEDSADTNAQASSQMTHVTAESLTVLEPAAEPNTDNVIPFERPRESDEELKRRIHDKVCDYHPPKPEEAAYIVKEGVESIEQYLDFQMSDSPQTGLDESRENPPKD